MKNFSKSATTVAGAILLGATCLTAAGLASAADAAATQRILSYSDMVKLTARTEAQLEAAKAATEKYRDINVAVAEGFVQGSPDVPGEGFHYLNPNRLDCKFEPGKPEILLYAILPGHTKPQLVSLEYAIPSACLPADCPPPKGFAGGLDVWHNDEPVPFWTVNAWLYLKNPDGLFTLENPNVP